MMATDALSMLWAMIPRTHLGRLAISLLLLPLAAASASPAAKSPPSFGSLGQATAFLDSCLEAKDAKRLEDATLQHQSTSFEALRKVHVRVALSKLYSGKEFPADRDRFKLGGHDSELGHVHVDFLKRDGKWFLESIWMCR